MSEALVGKVVAIAFVAVASVVILRNAYGKRHWLGFITLKFIACFAAMEALRFLIKLAGLHGWLFDYLAMGLAFSIYPLWVWKPSQSTYRKNRAEVIRRWQARTGKAFDPARYEVDHIVPLRAHGHHCLDNLRVITRKANRSKGGKEPKLEDWFQIWRRKDEE